MPAHIRPTLLLRMSLDEAVFNDDIAAELKRSYSYIAPVTVSSHPTGVDDPQNILRFIVSLRAPYWLSAEEGADETFVEIMEKWLTNMFNKVGNTLTAYNRVAQERGRLGLQFAWLELEFGSLAVALHLGCDSTIPAMALDLIKQVRTVCNTGALLGLEQGLVRLPSRRSLSTQSVAAVATGGDATGNTAVAATEAATGNTAAAASEDATEGTAAAASEDATEGTPPATEATAPPATEVTAPPATEATAAATVRETATKDTDAPKPRLNYSIWGIETTDGSAREYDSATDTFID